MIDIPNEYATKIIAIESCSYFNREMFYKRASQVLKPKGKLVIIFPVFVVNNQKQYLPILDKVKQIGFKTINPLEKIAELKATSRDSLLYARPNQVVQREIFIFEA